LIGAVQDLIVPFIKAADVAAEDRASGNITPDDAGRVNNVLVDFHQNPRELADKMKLSLPNKGYGKEGLLEAIQQVLRYSVNTWDQGFLDKLYASTNAVRLTGTEIEVTVRILIYGNRLVWYQT
jgi:glutamate decarboxylase